MLTSLEICAGAGGQALGLEQAGFDHVGLVEIDINACETLKANRPSWQVMNEDAKSFSAKAYQGIDLFAGGVPCPPFSVAGKQLGALDDRDLFPDAIRMIEEAQPKAILLENVKGIFSPSFKSYRSFIINSLSQLGYTIDWKLLNASHYGVSQLRPRSILVGFRNDLHLNFSWPKISEIPPLTIGELLHDKMGENGWDLVHEWKPKANKIAPTIVGGSKKHGGPDLGPTRAKKAWAEMGINGGGIADEAPEKHFLGMPKLTVRMAARVQGFPDEWTFTGRKTAAYRQVGNAFPPPVALAVGHEIAKALNCEQSKRYGTNFSRRAEKIS